MSQVKDAWCAASPAIDARADVRTITSTRRTVANGRLLPSRAIGTAPATWASIMASIIAAPPRVFPVSPSATSEKAIGPPACGTPSLADETNQRSSAHRLVGRSGDRAPPLSVWSLGRLAIVIRILSPNSARLRRRPIGRVRQTNSRSLFMGGRPDAPAHEAPAQRPAAAPL